MINLKTAKELGFKIGDFAPGPLNMITDVSGIKVGHATINKGDIQTGVTAVLPHSGNIFRDKLLAATHVINGFGKSIGLVQINEMGTLETPIVLTNTLSIGTATDSLIKYMLKKNPDIAATTGTVNPVICECNDGFLNDIRGMHVKKKHIQRAINDASVKFSQGSVGAGTGMSAYELKGGIGSASCILSIDGKSYVMGALVLSNMGKLHDLRVLGQPLGQRLKKRQITLKQSHPDGSIVMLLATDIPLCERQLGRISKRALIGLARTGSFIDSGSGEIVIAFSTANKISHYEDSPVIQIKRVNEEQLSRIFMAVVQCTEEAVLNSMLMSNTTQGIQGHTAHSLTEYLDLLETAGLGSGLHS